MKLLVAAIIAVASTAVLVNLLQYLAIDGRFVLFLGLGLPFAAMFGWVFLKRKRAKTCPSCSSEALIPVGSPEGLRIMKELGYVEA